MTSPQTVVRHWWQRYKAKTAATQAAHRGSTPDAEEHLASLGLGVPERLRIDVPRAESEVLLCEQTITTLRLQVTARGRELARMPSKLGRRVLTLALYAFEVGTLSYQFIEDLGYPAMTGVPMAFLYTTGAFALTKSLYTNVQKPHDERAWYTPILFVVFLLGGMSVIMLRLAGATPDTSTATNIAKALILCFVTLLPGWLAARYELDLQGIHELEADVNSLNLEYHQETLRVCGLRQGIHATTPEDLRLLDERQQLAAIYNQAFKNTRPRQEPQS